VGSAIICGVDGAIVLGLYGLAAQQPWLAGLAALVADYGIFVLPLALVVVWLSGGPSRRRAVVAGVLAAIVAIGLGLVLEHTLARPRPFVALGIAPLLPHAADSSFPSDHTLAGVALAGALAWRVPRVGGWLLGWALLVGAARVMAGLHYPSDIVGSAVLALALDGLAWRLVGAARL
jgi:undecaprenyl-diphosphatase